MVTEFLNPYNFIPLPDKKAKAYQTDDKNSRLHTGVIEKTAMLDFVMGL